MKNHLQAYRFSEEEINKMIELKGIFEQNDFKIDRFPEVYYDDYEIYHKKFKKNLNTEDVNFENIISDWRNNNIRDLEIDGEKIIDLLGVYTNFWIEGDEINTKQGKIILFRDRINIISKLGIPQKDLQFLVLMHELGHWLTHWPLCFNENWKIGYGENNPMTHESFAQLIAYWAVDGNPTLENILKTRLTPTTSNDPYALYKNLKGLSKSSILTKLIEIRKHYFLPDLILYSFLKHSKTDKMLNFFGEYLFSKEIDEEIISKCTKSKNTDLALTFFEELKKKIEDVMKDKEHKTNTNDKLKELMEKILPTNKLISQFKKIIHDLRGPNASKRFGL